MILGLAIIIVLFCAGAQYLYLRSYLILLHAFIGISTGGIIGIAIGVTAVAVLVGVIIAIGVIVMARKSRQQHGPVRTCIHSNTNTGSIE